MKKIKYISLCCFIFTMSCTDHDRIMKEYEKGNPNAEELLLHGLNAKNSHYIRSSLLDRALNGDEKSKQIIYAQIRTLGSCPIDGNMTVAVPIVVKSGK